MIPKVIHYCWFGGNRKSALIRRCIRSWKRHCPDYKIIEWNEENFDIACCDYVQQAYAQKKWAFVSDYARFWILHRYGGIYLDTDVQILKPLDPLLKTGCFAGFANDEIVATGLIMAAYPADQLCRKILEGYQKESFVWHEDPSKILAVGRRVTDFLVGEGLQLDGTQQKVGDYTIYPAWYFNSSQGDMFTRPDPRAYSIHHYAATWFTGTKRLKNTLRRAVGSKNMQRYYRLRDRFTRK